MRIDIFYGIINLSVKVKDGFVSRSYFIFFICFSSDIFTNVLELIFFV